MLNLSRASEGPAAQAVASDPGSKWIKDSLCAIDAPPDDDPRPEPDARWSPGAPRTGKCGAVTPRVVALAGGGYRLYYTQILPRPGYPAGALDYSNSTSRILSATSADAVLWTPEPGIRLTPAEGGAGEFRVVSPDVVPIPNGGGRLRMYFECARGSQSTPNAIRSAVSEDGGLEWRVEGGDRLTGGGRQLMSPRLVFLEDGRCRLYCAERGRGIVSAVSTDGGITFVDESGARVPSRGPYDSQAAFAPEILRVEGGGYVMYYAGYSSPRRAQVLRATSEDGLRWRKDALPVLEPSPGGLDGVKCSEMCVVALPTAGGGPPKHRMLYEGCDGTGVNARGVWRVLGATSAQTFPN